MSQITDINKIILKSFYLINFLKLYVRSSFILGACWVQVFLWKCGGKKLN